MRNLPLAPFRVSPLTNKCDAWQRQFHGVRLVKSYDKVCSGISLCSGQTLGLVCFRRIISALLKNQSTYDHEVADRCSVGMVYSVTSHSLEYGLRR